MKAVFWDRDGVLNYQLPTGSPKKLSELHLVPQTKLLLEIFRKLGYLNLVITNQPDIARGKLKLYDLETMHLWLKWMLPVDDIFVCPHDNGECDCRKPQPGMILQAIRKHNLTPSECLMIGNEDRDMEAGIRAGIKTFKYDTYTYPI